MRANINKIILSFLMLLNCSTFLLPWENYSNVQVTNGIVLISGNIILATIIFVLYFVSIFLYEKNGALFFNIGLCSLSMLFAIVFARFESLGRFSNRCLGPYLGVLSVVLNIVVFILIFVKAKRSRK